MSPSTTSDEARSFAGEKVFGVAPDRVFAALVDPDVLSKCIPDLVSAQKVDEHTLKCVVKPGFSFVRAQLKMTIAVNDVDATNRSAVIDIASKGIGTSMHVQCRIVGVESEARVSGGGDSSSRVKWEAKITEVSGLIAAVSPALIRGAADKVIHDGWESLRAILEG